MCMNVEPHHSSFVSTSELAPADWLFLVGNANVSFSNALMIKDI